MTFSIRNILLVASSWISSFLVKIWRAASVACLFRPTACDRQTYANADDAFGRYLFGGGEGSFIGDGCLRVQLRIEKSTYMLNSVGAE